MFKRFSLKRLVFTLIGLGIIIFGYGMFLTIQDKKTPVQYENLTVSDLNKGTIVEGDVILNYGPYEYIENKRNGVTTSTNYYYVIPVDYKNTDYSFMGLLVYKDADTTIMDDMADKSFAWANGDTDELPDQKVHFKGVVKKMTKEDQGYFDDYLVDIGLGQDVLNKYAQHYYIDIVNYDSAPTLLLFGGVLLGAGIIILVISLVAAGGSAKSSGTSQSFYDSASNGSFSSNDSSFGQADTTKVVDDDFDNFMSQYDTPDDTNNNGF